MIRQRGEGDQAPLPKPPGGRRGGLPDHRNRPGWVRRIVGFAALLAVLGALLVYRQLTDPERVRSAAVAYLDSILDAEVTLGSARFSLFDGIRIEDVRVVEHPEVGGALSETERTVLSVPELVLEQNPLAALVGRLQVEEIIAQEPWLALHRNDTTGRYNISRVLRQRTGEGGSPELPTVRLHRARVSLGRETARGIQPVEDMTLSVLARPSEDRQTYELFWTGGGRSRSSGKSVVDLTTRSVRDVEGGLPWLSVEGVMLAASARFEAADHWRQLLGLEGQLQVRDFNLPGTKQDQESKAVVELRQAAVSIPLDEEERSLPPAERYLHFTGVEGHLEVTPEEARAVFEGQLRGSRCTFDVQFRRGETAGLTLGEVGFEGTVELHGLVLPRRADPSRPEDSRFVNRFKKLRDFYRDFDPYGVVDLHIDLAKEPGAGSAIALRHARLTSLGTDAAYRFFPYRVRNIHGVVEYDGNGIHLQNLQGEHGEGAISVSGKVDAARWITAVQLDIQGRGISIDRDLYDALDGRYRRIWDRFRLEGGADINVAMNRPTGTNGKPAKWKTTIQARFDGLNAVFSGFPYPIEDISGELHIGPEGFEIPKLSGRAGDGSVVFSGSARVPDGGQDELDLEIRAEEIAIDDRFFAALPADARGTLERFHPTGRFDLAGRLWLDPDEAGLDYDLTASLGKGSVAHEDVPVSLENVGAEIRLRRERVDVQRLTGVCRRAEITATGWYDGTNQPSEVQVEVSADDLHLRPEMADLLPESVRAVWEHLRPSGLVDVRSRYRQLGNEPDTGTIETRIIARGVEVRPTSVPLPIRDLRGEVAFDASTITLSHLTGSAAEGALKADGVARRDGSGYSSRFSLSAKDVAFCEELRSALPWRLRRTWNNARPRGRFDLLLDPVEAAFPAAGDSGRWDFEGELELHDADVNLGVEMTELNGTLRGGGSISEAGLALEAEIALDKALVSKWRLREVTGNLLRATDGSVAAEKLSGAFCGGRVTGSAELEASPSGSRYNCTATVVDARLDRLLNATRKPKDEPLDVEGSVDARLYLSGEAGPGEAARGGGQVHISEARLFHTPLLLRVLSALDLTPPEEPVGKGQTVSAEFFVLGPMIELRDVLIRDETVALAGSGTVSRDPSALDLRLIAVSPHDWFRLPVVTELVEGTARELVEIQVSGPPSDPAVSARPLRGVSDALEPLLGAKN